MNENPKPPDEPGQALKVLKKNPTACIFLTFTKNYFDEGY
jgi:hypothetical protein